MPEGSLIMDFLLWLLHDFARAAFNIAFWVCLLYFVGACLGAGLRSKL